MERRAKHKRRASKSLFVFGGGLWSTALARWLSGNEPDLGAVHAPTKPAFDAPDCPAHL